MSISVCNRIVGNVQRKMKAEQCLGARLLHGNISCIHGHLHWLLPTYVKVAGVHHMVPLVLYRQDQKDPQL